MTIQKLNKREIARLREIANWGVPCPEQWAPKATTVLLRGGLIQRVQSHLPQARVEITDAGWDALKVADAAEPRP